MSWRLVKVLLNIYTDCKTVRVALLQMNEFDLIGKYFTWPSNLTLAELSVGDDAAVCNVEPGYQIATSIDTLISGVHFPKDTSAADIAYKALAVNLSDLAAMGAIPKYYTCLLYTSPSPRDRSLSRMPSSA